MSDVGGRLRGLLVSQFFGAFNDNAWRVIVTLLAIDAVQAGGGAEAAAQARTTLATVVLTVPLIVFSLPAGLISDRFSKRTVIVAMKAVEIVLMATAAWVLYIEPQGGVLALVVLGCMGAQSAIFSPSKYGILPELLPHSRLSLGNGVLEMWSTLAIIAGTASAGVLLGIAGTPWVAGAVLCLLSLAGFAAALTVPAVPKARTSGGLVASLRDGWGAIRADRVLGLAVVGSIFFWLVASVFFQVSVVYVKTHLGLANTPASLALGVLMAGIAAGSILAGRLSRRRVEYGLLPLGAMGLAVFTLLFGLLVPGFTGTLVLLLMMGISGGLINVPLNALKQWRSPADMRGSVLALANLFVYVGILAGSVGTGLLASAGFSSQYILLITAAGVIAATVWALWLLPDALVRLLLVLSTNTFYRLEVIGADRIPSKGGALLIPNHVSFIDAFLLLASTDRPIRFLADVTYYDHPLLHPFMKSLGAIPIAASGGPKLILRAMRAAGKAIERGEIVCIFPEGQITRIGMMLPFRRGFERIVKGRDVPIIPLFLDRVWGSIFSRSGGRFFTKVPARIPYPVTISVGSPLASNTPIHEVRRAVRELGTEAWMARIRDSVPLHHSFVRCFRSRPWKLAFADVTRPHISRFKALVGAIALSRALRKHWDGQETVGILLPSSGSAGPWSTSRRRWRARCR